MRRMKYKKSLWDLRELAVHSFLLELEMNWEVTTDDLS
jgi:hypothetical protein